MIILDLEEHYSNTNSVHLFHVEEAIHNCKQDNMTIRAYYTKLKGLWDAHDELCSIPTCTYGTMKEVLQFQQNQKNRLPNDTLHNCRLDHHINTQLAVHGFQQWDSNHERICQTTQREASN